MGHLKFKLNADGSSLDNPGRIGANALIRDHNGNWVIDAYRHIRRAASVEVELWALREIEADATPVLYFMQSSTNRNILLSHLVDECKKLFYSMSSTCWKHIFREGNKCVQIL
ncbi:uncharacterized protein LOC128041671 [Gossypium raimondii]|uniref:uncharacterized protein LOC128041671 n=1 Tax=Gossypium raimondii TaxID=29730 RepID=UPI00227A4776|nr:uncharacterized protein LOC128041671 [Gossypium raimondii]